MYITTKKQMFNEYRGTLPIIFVCSINFVLVQPLVHWQMSRISLTVSGFHPARFTQTISHISAEIITYLSAFLDIEILVQQNCLDPIA